MTTEATISSSVLRGLRADMARLAIDEGELVRCCRLPGSRCLSDDREIPLQCFVSALEFAADAGHCRQFGWQAGQHYDISYLGDLGEAVIGAPTLGSALLVFAPLSQADPEFQ